MFNKAKILFVFRKLSTVQTMILLHTAQFRMYSICTRNSKNNKFLNQTKNVFSVIRINWDSYVLYNNFQLNFFHLYKEPFQKSINVQLISNVIFLNYLQYKVIHSTEVSWKSRTFILIKWNCDAISWDVHMYDKKKVLRIEPT